MLNILLKFEWIDGVHTEDLSSRNCNEVNREEITRVSSFRSRFFTPLRCRRLPLGGARKAGRKIWLKRIGTRDRFPPGENNPRSSVKRIGRVVTWLLARDASRPTEPRFLSDRHGRGRPGSLCGTDPRDLSTCPAKTQAETSSAAVCACPPGERQRAYPHDLDSRRRHSTATDSNPNPNPDLRTISAPRYARRFRPPREAAATFRGRARRSAADYSWFSIKAKLKETLRGTAAVMYNGI